MEDLTRRGFMGTIGAVAAMGALATAGIADEAEGTAEKTGYQDGTPAELEGIGMSTMGLWELNQRRKAYVDSKTEDYVKADGTVVPNVYVKLRALTNTYMVGCGSEITDNCFDLFMMEFSEEDAAAYLDMPLGMWFTATEYAAASGRKEDDCLAICEDLASRGLLGRERRAGVPYFHQVALAHGIYEYGLNKYWQEGWTEAYRGTWTSDYATGYIDSGTPFYYAIPVSKDVVADEEIIVGDEWEKIIDRNTTIAVAPCQCRKIGMRIAGEDEPPAVGSEELKEFCAPCGHPLETCIAFGHQAEYYIENGIGRQIDQEEARYILQRSVDAGMIIQSAFTRDSYVICSCHNDCCRIIGVYKAVGPEGLANASGFKNASHYNLTYDQDACLKCGACVDRCPMDAITMNEETGYPEVSIMCMRCGQCGLACPVDARKLAAKPAEEIPEKPQGLVDNYNYLAAYRFEHGTIY